MTMTYAELQQAVQDFLETQETTFVNNIPLFIRMAEERILKSVQLSFFRKTATGTLTNGNPVYALPADFLSQNSFSFTDASGDKNFLILKDIDFIQTYNPDSTVVGAPKYYARLDVDNFILAPTPNSNYTVQLNYLYRPASLTAGASSGTTWLSENAELSLLYGTLVEAYIFLKGDADMQQLYDKRLQESLIGLKLLGEAKEPIDEYRRGVVMRERQ
ncbi:hypothetical protein UFOVP330_52 [uncultured Caudovirales phage]|uniref:Uncharacterized protein n=1 Tax=uncultured Caudovirales phage TaxID=2100421 RepID=A0A6J5LZC7_9CAUD|nr:hypothetical protein UFOVP330_52 [uncultured Caudovirales phage]